tara:strand:+ start:21900 stop:22565 length:666 start_codon:yes stop_codon:yes gene_type:complete
MEIEKRNRVNALIGVLTFVMLIILLKGFGKIGQNNHEHCDHNKQSPTSQSDYTVDTVIVDNIDTIYTESLDVRYGLEYDTIMCYETVGKHKGELIEVELVKKPTVIDSNSISTLIEAMIKVESRGDDRAYCKREEAVGCLQIRPVMVKEVNRLLKRRGDSCRYNLGDRWNREKSIEMFMVFCKHKTSLEQMARNWNGGPRGYKRSATIGYWKKVLHNMEEV